MRKLLVLTLSLSLLGLGLTVGCGDNQKVTKPAEFAPMPKSGPSGGPAPAPAPGAAKTPGSGAKVPVK